MKRIIAILAISFLAVAGCGKSGNKTDNEKTPNGNASSAVTEPITGAPFASEFAAAGWKVVQLRKFPGQVPGYKARAVVYRGNKRGGVLYVVGRPNGPHELWHWYFADAAPDSVAPVELNDDGLWDCRVYFGKKTRDFIQGKDFTLVTDVRNDLIALNGKAAGSGTVWHVFDGDSSTAWICAKPKAWIDVPAPLGLKDGVVTVQLMDTDRPKSMDVIADGKTVKTFAVAHGPRRQQFRLDTPLDGARNVRIQFAATAGRVAIGELSIR